MKAHLRAQRREPTALCAGFSEERRIALTEALRPCKIGVRAVTAQELPLPVGALAQGISLPAPPKAALHAGIECVVFCHLGEGMLDAALAALKGAGLFVPYKAVLTPTNGAWTLDHLIGELMREHEAVQGKPL